MFFYVKRALNNYSESCAYCQWKLKRDNNGAAVILLEH